MRRAFLFSIICTACTLSLCEFSPSARKNAAVDYEAFGHCRLNKRVDEMVEVYGKQCGMGTFYSDTQMIAESTPVCRKIMEMEKSCLSRSPSASPQTIASKLPSCGIKNLRPYQGKLKFYGTPNQFYEYPIRSKKYLGKTGPKSHDLLILKHWEGVDCKVMEIVRRGLFGRDSVCEGVRKMLPKSKVQD